MRKSAAILFLLLVSTAAAHANCVQQVFNAPRNAALPSFVRASADFDGDKKPDLVAGSEIVLATGRHVALPSGIAFTDLVADVNGDGLADLAGGNSSEIIAYVNNGDATFTKKSTSIRVNAFPSSFSWGDFNGDGLPDVYVKGVYNELFQSTPVYLGVGDGTFKPEFGANITGFTFLTADLNGDGRDDIIADQSGRLAIYLRQGNGFAAPQYVTPLPGPPSFLTYAADFNGDARDDIIFVPNSLAPPQFTIVFDLGGSLRSAATFDGVLAQPPVDVDGDGAPDLLIDTTSGRDANLSPIVTGLQVLLNDGRGHFRVTETLPTEFQVVFVRDFDGDGVPDLLVSTGSATFVLHGNGDGTFRVPRMALPAADSGVAGDFDGDGDDDIALPKAMAWNNGDNTFRVVATSDPRLEHPRLAADVDGDGRAEVVSTMAPATVVVLSPHPDGTIGEVGRIAARAVAVAVGNFTGNRIELALVADTLRNIEVYDIRTGVARATMIIEGGARGIAAADLNRDGTDDIIVSGGTIVPNGAYPPSESRDGFVSIFLSTGPGFGSERRLAYPNAALHELVAGDFDGDGKPDFAATEMYASFAKIVAVFGDGAAGFGGMKTYSFSSSEGNHVLRAADLDGDGRTDLALNGAEHLFYGTATGLEDRGSYFGARMRLRSSQPDALTYAPLVVRPGRLATPWIIVPTQFGDAAFVYRPLCAAHPRAVRH